MVPWDDHLIDQASDVPSIILFKVFNLIYSTKINPRGASIHRINELAPLMRSLRYAHHCILVDL